MAFWTEASIELKRKSRFLVELGSGFILTSVKTCSKPAAEVDIKEYQLINHKFKYPGIVTWQPVKITFVDMAGQKPEGHQTVSTAIMLERMLKYSGYNIPTRANGPIAKDGPQRELSAPEKASTIANSFGTGLHGAADTNMAQVLNSAKKGGTNNQSIKIHQLTPDGTKSVETWILHNPQIKSVSWGDLAYDSDDFIEYSVDIVYDFAEMQIGAKIPALSDFDKAAAMNAGFSSELNAQKSFEEVQAEIARRAAVNDALDSVQLSDTSGIGGGRDLGQVTGMGGGTLDEFQPIKTASIAEDDYYKSPQREKKDGAYFGSYESTQNNFVEPEHIQLENAYYEKRRKDGD